MLGAEVFEGPCGLAETPLEEPILTAWDEFLTVVDSADLSRPSRLKGLSARDVCVHLGTWDDYEVMAGLEEAARTGSGGASGTPDDINKGLLAAHREASVADVRAALERSRTNVATWFSGTGPAEIGRHVVRSTVGELPLLTVLHAGCYELAVHALDLRGRAPSDALLDRGLAALIDVTGALAAKQGIAMSLHAQAPEGGWAFTSLDMGWSVGRSDGTFRGPGVKGTAADLLDASAGRAALPSLLVQRRLKVQDMPGFLKLAPMINDVPGLPGGPVLRAGVNALNGVSGGVTKALARFRR